MRTGLLKASAVQHLITCPVQECHDLPPVAVGDAQVPQDVFKAPEKGVEYLIVEALTHESAVNRSQAGALVAGRPARCQRKKGGDVLLQGVHVDAGKERDAVADPP